MYYLFLSVLADRVGIARPLGKKAADNLRGTRRMIVEKTMPDHIAVLRECGPRTLVHVYDHRVRVTNCHRTVGAVGPARYDFLYIHDDYIFIRRNAVAASIEATSRATLKL